MNEDYIVQIKEGVQTAFIDYNYNSTLAYRPQFVSNNYREGKKVLASIEDELLSCDSFQISVAFITLGGIEPLLLTLKQLEEKGIKLSKEQLDEFIDSIKEKLNLKKDQEVIIDDEPNTTEE